jgi:Family of unknown function (DUF5996)
VSTAASLTTTAWPKLPLEEWQPTYATLHLWTQIVGKTRLRLSPKQNHWWHCTLYVTSRGLGTSPMPYGERTFEIDFDFLDHQLVARTSDGESRAMALVPRTVAEFYREYLALLGSLGVDVRIHGSPNEIPEAIPFAKDSVHGSYDAEAAQRCWRILVNVDRALKEFRGSFVGKSSPVHFWWGAFDLACTRFSGLRAPRHPGGVPNLPDYVTREGYSHECISAGWWPGSGPIAEPAFYAYAYPEPPGCSDAPVGPAGARYDVTMHEWILPYDAVRNAAEPHAAVMEFLQSTYDAAAKLGNWNRRELEAALHM